jgi:ferredoxin-NADP reductase
LSAGLGRMAGRRHHRHRHRVRVCLRRQSGSAIGVEPGWRGLRPLRVEAVVPESSTITSVYLAAEDGSALPPALPGQYLTLRVPEAGDPPPIRSYSLSSAPGSDAYRISVKLEGLVSSYVHTKLHVGASVQAAAPRGEFVLASGAEPVLLISAGVGVTPVLAMLHKLAAERSEREVWWLHTARDAGQQAFAREAHGLLSTLPSAHELVFHTASDGVPSDGRSVGSPDGGSGVLADGMAAASSGGGDGASVCGAAGLSIEGMAAASSGEGDGDLACGAAGVSSGGRAVRRLMRGSVRWTVGCPMFRRWRSGGGVSRVRSSPSSGCRRPHRRTSAAPSGS